MVVVVVVVMVVGEEGVRERKRVFEEGEGGSVFEEGEGGSVLWALERLSARTV